MGSANGEEVCLLRGRWQHDEARTVLRTGVISRGGQPRPPRDRLCSESDRTHEAPPRRADRAVELVVAVPICPWSAATRVDGDKFRDGEGADLALGCRVSELKEDINNAFHQLV